LGGAFLISAAFVAVFAYKHYQKSDNQNRLVHPSSAKKNKLSKLISNIKKSNNKYEDVVELE
jgi:hypothetical protein